ncbi:MAG TPA: folate-binding protein [Stellaceae bacterium]|nr:folate-binding protein [Stellaceae bacterium]
MVRPAYAMLAERGVLEIAGADRHAFLQGLISNDVSKAAPDRAIHAALLTAQGKYLNDFFVVALGEALYLDAEAARLEELRRRLSLYKLRSKVTLAIASERFGVAVAWGTGAAAALGLPEQPGAAREFAGGLAYVDPRLAALGARALLPCGAGTAALAEAGLAQGDAAAYDRLRLSLGVPDGSRDLEVERAILLESGFDELNGIDWQKGCYMGQELTARTKYRALIKKRLLPVDVEGKLPPPGTPVMLGDAEAGELRSGRDGLALALLRLEAVEAAAKTGAALTAGEARLTPHQPEWLKLPQ